MKIVFVLALLFTIKPALAGDVAKKSVKIIELLPASPDKTGTADYTNIIQQALNTYDTLYFPPFTLRIKRTGITLKSNQVLYFDKGSELLLEPNNLPEYHVINIKDVSNVKIYDLNIQGDRDTHNGKGGEWGMGVSILGSKNVYLYNPVINNCWGDGIYIGESQQLNYCDGVYISGASCDRNRRNGVSIISGKNISIKNSTFSKSDGTAPMCGIAIEPNNSGNVLENIVLDNIKTVMNPNSGISITLDKWGVNSKTSNFRNVQGNISVKILNPNDAGGKYSLFLMTNSGGNKNAGRGTPSMGGTISVINPSWNPNISLLNVDNYANYGPKVDIQMPALNKKANTSNALKTAASKTDALKGIINQPNILIHYN